MIYKAKNNTIVDQDGKQIAVVIPVGCSMKQSKVMAAYAAQQMNHDERRKRWPALPRARCPHDRALPILAQEALQDHVQ